MKANYQLQIDPRIRKGKIYLVEVSVFGSVKKSANAVFSLKNQEDGILRAFTEMNLLTGRIKPRIDKVIIYSIVCLGDQTTPEPIYDKNIPI